jgi:hypothetical protein
VVSSNWPLHEDALVDGVLLAELDDGDGRRESGTPALASLAALLSEVLLGPIQLISFGRNVQVKL